MGEDGSQLAHDGEAMNTLDLLLELLALASLDGQPISGSFQRVRHAIELSREVSELISTSAAEPVSEVPLGHPSDTALKGPDGPMEPKMKDDVRDARERKPQECDGLDGCGALAFQIGGQRGGGANENELVGLAVRRANRNSQRQGLTESVGRIQRKRVGGRGWMARHRSSQMDRKLASRIEEEDVESGIFELELGEQRDDVWTLLVAQSRLDRALEGGSHQRELPASDVIELASLGLQLDVAVSPQERRSGGGQPERERTSDRHAGPDMVIYLTGV